MNNLYSYLILKIINEKSLAAFKKCTHCQNEINFYSFEYADNAEQLSVFPYCKLCFDLYLENQGNYYSIKYFPCHKDYDLFIKQLNECELALKKILLLR